MNIDELDNLLPEVNWTEEMSPQWKHMRDLEYDLEIDLFHEECRKMGIPNRADPENKWIDKEDS